MTLALMYLPGTTVSVHSNPFSCAGYVQGVDPGLPGGLLEAIDVTSKGFSSSRRASSGAAEVWRAKIATPARTERKRMLDTCDVRMSQRWWLVGEDILVARCSDLYSMKKECDQRLFELVIHMMPGATDGVNKVHDQ